MIDINKWQTLIGATIGAMAPFILWWVTDIYRKQIRHTNDLYYLEKILSYQINNLTEIDLILKSFINNVINEIVSNIKSHNSDQFIIPEAFFPLISFAPMDNEILKIDTRNYYIDALIAKSHQVSNNLTLQIEDARNRFFATINQHRELALKEIITPSQQNENLLDSLTKYKASLEESILKNNFGLFLKILIQAQTIVIAYNRMGAIRWSLKFNPWYKFYLKKDNYLEARDYLFDKVINHFRESVEERYVNIIKDMN